MIYKLIFTFILFMVFQSSAVSKEVRILASEYPPYFYSDNEGRINGFAYEWFLKVSKLIGLKSEIEVLPWARVVKVASDNKNVLVLVMGQLESRANKFDWAQPYLKDKLGLFTLRSREDIQIRTPEELSNYSLAVYRSGAPVSFLQKLRKSNKSIAMVENRSQLVNLLLKERVDIAIDFYKGFEDITKEITLADKNILAIKDLTSTEVKIGFALSKNSDPKWIDKINKAQTILQSNGEYEILVKKWFGE